MARPAACRISAHESCIYSSVLWASVVHALCPLATYSSSTVYGNFHLGSDILRLVVHICLLCGH